MTGHGGKGNTQTPKGVLGVGSELVLIPRGPKLHCVSPVKGDRYLTKLCLIKELILQRKKCSSGFMPMALTALPHHPEAAG